MSAVIAYDVVGVTPTRPAATDFSDNLDTLGPVDLSPPILPVDIAPPTADAVVSELPISELELSVDSYRMPTFMDDYYYRIHIDPNELILGNIVSEQVNPVYVWNAYLESQTMTAEPQVQEGVNLTGQPSAPLLFNALQVREYTLSVTPDGTPVLDTYLHWAFGSGDDVALHITATRIIGWSFAPDWGDSITERLSFSTDIQRSESCAELRRALLLSPRREFEARMYVEGRERQLLDMMLFGWGARTWALPVWPDIQWLTSPVTAGSDRIDCSTDNLDFRAGGLAMLRGEDAIVYEVVEINAIDSAGLDLVRGTARSWGRGSRLYPVRTAQLLDQPALERITDQAQGARVRFRLAEISDWPEMMPTTLYRGWPVLEERPDETENLTSQFQRLVTELDSGLSLPLRTDIAERALTMLGYRWIDMGREKRAAWRSLIYALRGRQAALWLPTFADDITLSVTIEPADTGIDVVNIGYSRFGQQRPGRRDIRIELRDGTIFHRRITASTEIDDEIERLVIDGALGRQVTPEQVGRISYLSLCRGANDTVEIEHITDSEGPARSAVSFQGVRDDEF